MAKKGSRQKKYCAEFKISVIMGMRENHLGYRETARNYGLVKSSMGGAISTLHRWERIYLEEGAAGFMKERRGRKSTGSPRKRPLDRPVEEELKKTRCLNSSGRGTERQKAEIVSELRQRFPLKALLALSQLPRSTYYYHVKRRAEDKYSFIKPEIERIFTENKQRYGYRRILLVLREKGIKLNHKTVHKLMRSMGLQGKRRKSKYKSYKGEVGRIAPNILSRDFAANKPFEKLATDVTEFAVCDDKVYLSPIIDLHNNEVISYSISRSPNFWQTREMLQGLFDKLPQGARPILHSDQGWQYQMKEFQRQLKEHNIVQSMSRKGNCLDNSVMENFFGRLKVEMFYGEKFQTVDEFVHCLKEYIHYWNNKRISLKLKGMSPVKYRTHSKTI